MPWTTSWCRRSPRAGSRCWARPATARTSSTTCARALTQVLIEQHGFRAVVIEGDWPDAWRINRWVRGLTGGSARRGAERLRALPDLDVAQHGGPAGSSNGCGASTATARPGNRWACTGWTCTACSARSGRCSTTSTQADPEAARARAAATPASTTSSRTCRPTATRPVSAPASAARTPWSRSSPTCCAQRATGDDGDPDALFHAQQNARLVRNAEQYYRSMYRGRASSWNLRDLHMADTLQALSAHLQERTGTPRAWPCGRTTRTWATRGRPGWPSRASGTWASWCASAGPTSCFLLGFTTYEGTVRAASGVGRAGRGQAGRARPGGKLGSRLP